MQQSGSNVKASTGGTGSASARQQPASSTSSSGTSTMAGGSITAAEGQANASKSSTTSGEQTMVAGSASGSAAKSATHHAHSSSGSAFKSSGGKTTTTRVTTTTTSGGSSGGKATTAAGAGGRADGAGGTATKGSAEGAAAPAAAGGTGGHTASGQVSGSHTTGDGGHHVHLSTTAGGVTGGRMHGGSVGVIRRVPVGTAGSRASWGTTTSGGASRTQTVTKRSVTIDREDVDTHLESLQAVAEREKIAVVRLCAALKAKLATMSWELEQVTTVNQTLHAENQAMYEEMLKLDETTAHLQSTQETVTTTQETLVEVKQSASVNAARVEEFQASKVKVEAELAVVRQTNKAKLDQLTSQTKRLQQDARKKTADIEAKTIIVSTLEQRYQQLTRDERLLVSTTSSLQTEWDTAKDQHEELRTRVSDTTKEKHLVQERLDTSRVELERLVAVRKDLRAKVKAQETEIEALQVTIGDLKVAKSAVGDSKADLDVQLKRAMRFKKTMMDNLDSAHGETVSIKSRLAAKQAEIARSVRVREVTISEMWDEKEALQAALRSLLSEFTIVTVEHADMAALRAGTVGASTASAMKTSLRAAATAKVDALTVEYGRAMELVKSLGQKNVAVRQTTQTMVTKIESIGSSKMVSA
ncbi:hypothetical protein I4F81_003982 [Pyropia yezoensis]|uniref:Uncharacterized protein n=1 Tax=Pyropia yezoensis TaxID=2788 RepID=A0ACC3BU16_PYRYE|nr:hypothetical protein I4F81_003982 [Neopyropia yezoensis]